MNGSPTFLQHTKEGRTMELHHSKACCAGLKPKCCMGALLTACATRPVTAAVPLRNVKYLLAGSKHDNSEDNERTKNRAHMDGMRHATAKTPDYWQPGGSIVPLKPGRLQGQNTGMYMNDPIRDIVLCGTAACPQHAPACCCCGVTTSHGMA